jgi:hypothetical protein
VETRILQPWKTIRGSGTTPVIQDLSTWLDCEGFADITLYLEVAEITVPGAGSVQLLYETSVTRDSLLFAPMATLTPTVTPPPTVTSIRLTESQVPLARYVRWKLQGTQSGTWDITFRVAAVVGWAGDAFTPKNLPGCTLWLRGDLGIHASGTNVSQWDDQSGNGHIFLPGATQPSIGSGINGQPTVDFDGAATSITCSDALSTIITASAWTAFAVYDYTGTATTTATSYMNPPIIRDVGAFWGLFASTQNLIAYCWDGADKSARPTASANTNYYATTLLLSGTIFAEENLLGTSSAASGNITTLTNSVNLGAAFGAGAWFKGSVGEIIVYNRALSSPEAVRVQRYLSANWRI